MSNINEFADNYYIRQLERENADLRDQIVDLKWEISAAYEQGRKDGERYCDCR